ncbi:MAG: recombinase family protein, partial [Desulfuromonadales bacterium]
SVKWKVVYELPDYVRVSIVEKNLDLQIDALKTSGCARIVTDKASSAKLVRPGLELSLHGFSFLQSDGDIS